MAVIAFIIAIICASGLVLANDTVGKILFTVTWVFVGIWWCGKSLTSKQQSS